MASVWGLLGICCRKFYVDIFVYMDLFVWREKDIGLCEEEVGVGVFSCLVLCFYDLVLFGLIFFLFFFFRGMKYKVCYCVIIFNRELK
jgi:hypothetical protein